MTQDKNDTPLTFAEEDRFNPPVFEGLSKKIPAQGVQAEPPIVHNPPEEVILQKINSFEVTETYTLMFKAAIAAFLINLSYISWLNGYGWNDIFLVVLVGNGLSAFITFFHEIGHTITFWFYGYVTLLSFDFKHGGGWSFPVTDQLLVLNLAVYGGLGYFAYLFRTDWRMVVAALALAVFHLATAYTILHKAMFDFMGPASEALFAAFFLYRSWLDLAPRGYIERFLNAMFGWAMTFHIMIEGWGLLYNEESRSHYFHQKSGHGAGDFDQISDILEVDFSSVVLVWMVVAIIAVIVPYRLYLKHRNS